MNGRMRFFLISEKVSSRISFALSNVLNTLTNLVNHINSTMSPRPGRPI